MPSPPPAAEVELSPELVGRLLRAQHPDLADLALVEVAAGWDNSIYRLGPELAVRLPRRELAATLIAQEQRWLPELAPRLPLPIPVPRRRGEPGEGYPWPWSISPWLPGHPAVVRPPTDELEAARALAAFLRALHQPAPPEAPHNPFRGVPLVERDEAIRSRLHAAAGRLDHRRLLARWQEMVSVADHSGPPLWVHGDVHSGNLLVEGGRLSAVIDFGDLNAGDPACDLAVGWMLFGPSGRQVLADELPHGPDCWARAEGWAIAYVALLCDLPAHDPLAPLVGRLAIELELPDG